MEGGKGGASCNGREFESFSVPFEFYNMKFTFLLNRGPSSSDINGRTKGTHETIVIFYKK